MATFLPWPPSVGKSLDGDKASEILIDVKRIQCGSISVMLD